MDRTRLLELAAEAERLAGSVPPRTQDSTDATRPWEDGVRGLWMACYERDAMQARLDPHLRDLLAPMDLQQFQENFFQVRWNAVENRNQEWGAASRRLGTIASALRAAAARLGGGAALPDALAASADMQRWPPVPFGLSNAHHRILAKVLEVQRTAGVLRPIEPFRIKVGKEGRSAIEDLQRRQFFRLASHGGYRLSLKGLWALATEGGSWSASAREVLQDCDTLLGDGREGSPLAALYTEDHSKIWPVTEIAERTGLTPLRVQMVFAFLEETLLWGGSTTDETTGLSTAVRISEHVLDVHCG